jgi:hypothetical protein
MASGWLMTMNVKKVALVLGYIKMRGHVMSERVEREKKKESKGSKRR